MKKQNVWYCIWLALCLLINSCQKEVQFDAPYNATPISGSASVENTDSLSGWYPNIAYDWKISWDSTSNFWYIKLSYRPLPSYTLVIYLPGTTPPKVSGTYTLQQNVSPLSPTFASIRFYYAYGFETFPHPQMKDYYSLSGMVKIDVTNGQVSASFLGVPLRDEFYEETITLSGHITCH